MKHDMAKRLWEALNLPHATTELTLHISAEQPFLVATVTHFVPDAEGRLTDVLRTVRLVEAPSPEAAPGTASRIARQSPPPRQSKWSRLRSWPFPWCVAKPSRDGCSPGSRGRG